MLYQFLRCNLNEYKNKKIYFINNKFVMNDTVQLINM